MLLTSHTSLRCSRPFQQQGDQLCVPATPRLEAQQGRQPSPFGPPQRCLMYFSYSAKQRKEALSTLRRAGHDAAAALPRGRGGALREAGRAQRVVVALRPRRPPKRKLAAEVLIVGGHGEGEPHVAREKGLGGDFAGVDAHPRAPALLQVPTPGQAGRRRGGVQAGELGWSKSSEEDGVRMMQGFCYWPR